MGMIRDFERSSGVMLRQLMAFSAAFGVLVAVITIVEMEPGGIISVPLYIVPYLVIRYRDPASTTLPYQRRLDRLVGG